MELADAPIEVKQLLSSRAVTPSLALDELRVNGAAAVDSLREKASERKASGKKGPAAKPVAKAPKPAPAPPSQSLIAVLREVLDDVAITDLTNESLARDTVDRVLLLKLASFAVAEEESKPVAVAV